MHVAATSPVLLLSLHSAASVEVYKAVGFALVVGWLVLEAAHRLGRTRRNANLVVGTHAMGIVRVAGVLGLGVAAAGSWRSGTARIAPFNTLSFTVPTTDLDALNAEYNAIIARCADSLDQLNRARLQALADVPAAKSALDQHDQAVGKAQTARSDADTAAADARSAAQEKAEQDDRDAKDKADRDRLGAMSDADFALNSGEQKAEDDYSSRLAEIAAAVESAAAKAEQRAQAQRDHDAALRTAQRTHDTALATIERTYEKAYVAANELHIAANTAAWRVEQAARDAAGRALDRAQAAAEAALDQALAKSPAAKAISDDFAARRASLNASCDRDKQAVLDRIKQG